MSLYGENEKEMNRNLLQDKKKRLLILAYKAAGFIAYNVIL